MEERHVFSSHYHLHTRSQFCLGSKEAHPQKSSMQNEVDTVVLGTIPENVNLRTIDISAAEEELPQHSAFGGVLSLVSSVNM